MEVYRLSWVLWFLVFSLVPLMPRTSFAQSWWEKNRDLGSVNADSDSDTTLAPSQTPAADSAPAPGENLSKPMATPQKEQLPDVEASPPPAPAPMKRKKRRQRAVTSSDTSETSVSAKANKEDLDNIFRLSFLGGFSPSSSAPSSGGTGSISTSLASLGLNADLQLHYFGFEGDGFYGFGTGTDTSGSTSTAFGVTSLGGYLAAKGQLPFYTGSVRWVPKLGIGFSAYSESFAVVGSSSAAAQKNSLSGAYGEVGFEVYLLSWLILTADYSHSLAASGTMSGVILGGTTVSAPMQSPDFSRIRAGGIVRLSDHFDLGVQFVDRIFNWGSSGVAESESQSVILGTIGLEW